MRYLYLYLSALSLPFITYAQAPSDFKSLVALLVDFINTIIVFLMVLMFVVIVWGVLKGWVIEGGSEEGVESGKQILLAGIIGFVVFVSFWGILALLQTVISG